MDELEYHVTFPINFSKPKEDADEISGNSSVRKRAITGDMRTVPVIFLLGWYGCKDKHLAKYSSIYETKGYITIRYTLPHDYLFSRKKGSTTRDVALKVLEAFFDQGLEENPLFFHAFSNGGGFIYRHITEIVNGPNPGQYAALNIAGVICDSMPSCPSPSIAYRAMVSAMPRSQHWIITFIKGIGLWIFFMMLTLSSYIWKGSSDWESYYRALQGDNMPCPQLFLYSKKDELIPYTHIQGVIKERQRRGFDVREVLWEDSAHVAHFRKHPEEYETTCLEFVEDCLEMVY